MKDQSFARSLGLPTYPRSILDVRTWQPLTSQTRGCGVYAAFNRFNGQPVWPGLAADALIYVGSTLDWGTRARDHQRNSGLTPDRHDMAWQPLSSKLLAQALEYYLIHRHLPVHNRIGHGPAAQRLAKWFVSDFIVD